MSDEADLPRFLVRRGATRDWMVWDRHTKGPARYQGHLVVGLSEDVRGQVIGNPLSVPRWYDREVPMTSVELASKKAATPKGLPVRR
jgi:hypothetical protein